MIRSNIQYQYVCYSCVLGHIFLNDETVRRNAVEQSVIKTHLLLLLLYVFVLQVHKSNTTIM